MGISITNRLMLGMIIGVKNYQRKKFAHAKKKLDVRNSLAETTANVAQSIRQHLWFFTVDDCDHSIKNYFKSNPGNAILQIEIHITNSNGSEFSSEETGIIYLILILSIANIFIFLYNFRKLRMDFKKNEELDWPLTILIIAIGLEVLHNNLLLGHLTVYASNGYGVWTFKFLSEVFEVKQFFSPQIFVQVLSRFILTLLLILIAWGWSIKFISVNQFDFFIPIGIFKFSLIFSYYYRIRLNLDHRFGKDK